MLELTSRRLQLAALSTLVLALTVAAVGTAQDLHPSRRPSPMGMARTTIDGTYARVVYSRPYKRGRDNIFGTAESGALVPFGEIWRTGANEATEITLTGDLRVGDQILAAGTYSLFTTPGPASWTVRFNSALGLSGTMRPNPESGALEPADLDATEVLTYSAMVTPLAEEVDQFTIAFEPAANGADMCLRWILTEVCVPLRAVAR
jgi:Protein of unknown function (DUF2911)